MRLSDDLLPYLRCPRCAGRLERCQGALCCNHEGCATRFPLVDGCPILINDAESAFRVQDFVEGVRTTGQVERGPVSSSWRDRAKAVLRRLVPGISYNTTDYELEDAVARISAECPHRLRILVLGAGDSVLKIGPGHDVVYTDVDLGSLTTVVCDAHDIPFKDASFDFVACISVLEHVADPYRCTAEIHRVLRADGCVYAVTPFMPQVHMGAYDFTRFTHLGPRRLSRRFIELRSGVSCGPGMALTWSIERFVSGFATQPRTRSALRTLARFLAFPIKYFDWILARRPSAYDSASSYYFFGRRADTVLSDRELVRTYRGVVR
nr:class I SAM-dependent methyltransferase [Thiohalocapsa sp.]